MLVMWAYFGGYGETDINLNTWTLFFGFPVSVLAATLLFRNSHWAPGLIKKKQLFI